MEFVPAIVFTNLSNLWTVSGGDNVRPYWNRYYSGAQGIIFVVDSTADEKSMDVAKEEFDKAINDDQLEGLPLLFLANYQDRPGAATQDQVRLKGHTENFIKKATVVLVWFKLPCKCCRLTA